MYVHSQCGYPLLVATSWSGSDFRLVVHDSASAHARTDSPITTCPQCCRKVVVMRAVYVVQPHSSEGQRPDSDSGEGQDHSQARDTDMDMDMDDVDGIDDINDAPRHQPLARLFMDERRRRLQALQAAMEARHAAMTDQTWTCLLRSLEAHEHARALLADVAQVRRRIRAGQHMPADPPSAGDDHWV